MWCTFGQYLCNYQSNFQKIKRYHVVLTTGSYVTGTSSSSLPQLLVLNETSKHLGVHEELQELADSAGGMSLAEAVALELLASVGGLDHVEGIVTHQLHEEPHETLGHQGAQVSLLTWTGQLA